MVQVLAKKDLTCSPTGATLNTDQKDRNKNRGYKMTNTKNQLRKELFTKMGQLNDSQFLMMTTVYNSLINVGPLPGGFATYLKQSMFSALKGDKSINDAINEAIDIHKAVFNEETYELVKTALTVQSGK